MKKPTKYFYCIFILFFAVNNNVLSQKNIDINKNIYQRYEFENDEIAVSMESEKLYIFENDSCLIKINVKNKMKNDIYVIDWKRYFSYSIIDSSILFKAIVEFGGDFNGAIDYPVNMKKIKSNNLYSERIIFFSNIHSDKYIFSDNINIMLNLGYLKSEFIDSLKSFYPAQTNIKTEKISNDKLKTSALGLYFYLKKIEVGSLLIEYRKEK